LWFCRITRDFHEKAARVKSLFGRATETLDRRPTGGAMIVQASSSKEGFWLGLRTKPIADQREAHNAPSFLEFTIAESPRFHPHSLWSCLLRCQLVSSIATGAAISEPNWMISTSEDLRSWRVPQSPELDDFQ
jgi:hypothetical protein